MEEKLLIKNKQTLAILVNGQHKVMGTFSKGYIEHLPYKKVVLFGGLIPIFKVGTPKWKQKLIRYWLTLLALKNPQKIEQLKIKRLTNILKREKIDIALCEFLNTAASAMPACKNANIAMISNVLGYEINDRTVIERFKEKYKALAKYQAHTIPVAKDMIPKLVELGFNDSDITYSPIGPTEDFFKISPNYKSQQFIAIGRFCETKAPHNTILAFNKASQVFPDAKLVMAGTGELMGQCLQLVEQLNIKDKVTFVGWINKEQQKQLLSESMAFVQHSVTAKNGDREGTPVAILEASAAALPIISTLHAGIPDTVANNVTGFLSKENDWESMGDHMIQLLSNKNLCLEMGEKGKKLVKENFSEKQHLHIITNIIQSII
ncbi:hypothetical protein BPO_1794 [Bergeyella porcorum]|uniref:Glycosyl transferase family 1 domain-containing protein n=1 Tax=Bergeyella porcorum TaxID=1735111 RepID=A0AAU0F2W8_9FLAO